MSSHPAQAAGEAAYDRLLEAAVAGNACDCRTCLVRAVLEAAAPHLDTPST